MIRDVHPGSQIQGSKKGTGSRSQIRIRYTAVECHDINGISLWGGIVVDKNMVLYPK
jgi:hypothetical protein